MQIYDYLRGQIKFYEECLALNKDETQTPIIKANIYIYREWLEYELSK